MKSWRNAGPRTRAGRHPADRRLWRQLPKALVAASALLTAATASAGCSLTQMEIPVRIVNHRPIATLSLNGTEVPMLVDSGAFFSFLSESAATQLKLPLRNLPDGLRIEGYTGRVEARLTRVETVGLVDAQMKNVEFIVGGNELGAGIMGILGRNILARADTEYDLAHGVVRLMAPKGECATTNLAYWAGDAPVVEVALDHGANSKDSAIRLPVLINGKRTTAMLDTGAPTTALTLRAARRAGIMESDMTPVGRVGGGGAGLAKSWSGPVDLFELGGEKVRNSRMLINDVDNLDDDMLVGLDYFLSHRIYVSRLQGQVYVTWNGAPVFAPARENAADPDARYAALPKAVAKDDADALARRGAAAIASGNLERALEDLNRACELAPTVAENFHLRAQLQVRLRQAQPALADLDRALQLEPALAEARHLRAWLHAQMDNRPGAQADLTHLDDALPPSAPLRADMAQLFAGLDQPAEALKQYGLWINSHPNDARMASALNERCWLRARLNLDLPLALKDCKRAVDLDDEEAAHHDSLGWTYLRLGDGARAKKAFDGAIKLKALPFSLYGRGQAQLQLKNPAAAEQDLAAARQLSSTIEEDVRKEGFDFAAGAARAGEPGS